MTKKETKQIYIKIMEDVKEKYCKNNYTCEELKVMSEVWKGYEKRKVKRNY